MSVSLLARTWYGVYLAIAAFPFLSDLLASHSAEHLPFVSLCFVCFLFRFLSFVLSFVLFFVFFMVWLVLLCSLTRYAGTSLASP